LYATGKIPWKTYSDILAEAIFNMDELGNDTTKHSYQKTPTGSEKVNTTCTFMQTSEGDGHMPWHITICLTTHGDGKFQYLNRCG